MEKVSKVESKNVKKVNVLAMFDNEWKPFGKATSKRGLKMLLNAIEDLEAENYKIMFNDTEVESDFFD